MSVQLAFWSHLWLFSIHSSTSEWNHLQKWALCYNRAWSKIISCAELLTTQICFQFAFVTVTYWYILCDEKLPQCSQLSQSTTIVAKKTTIIDSNLNCRNTNHKGRNFFWNTYCVFNVDYVQNHDISSNFQRLLPHNLTMRIVEHVAHHKPILQLSQFGYLFWQ